MPSCNLCGRTQNAKSKENKITFHRYPKCPDIYEKWIEFSRRYDEHRSIIVNEKSVVCSAHFAADSFNVYIKNTMLKSTAIPSLIIQRVRFAKLDYPEKTTNLHSEEKQKVDDMEDIGCSSSITSNFPKLLEPQIDGVECLELSSSYGKITNANDSPITVKNISNNKLPTKNFSVLSNDTDLKSKKIKMLNQTIRRQRKIIVSLKCIISSLKDNNLINEDTSTLLLDNFGENKHLISRLAKKNARITPTKKYCPELRRFAISLHFRSVSAYNFVRKEFNTILPHPRTLGKWYSNINCESGFTTEALNTLALKCRNTLKPVCCALVMDEMAVRQHVEWDGTNYHGYVNVGESIFNETMEKAKEALVFLVVALNEAWKIPVGYFLINHINSSQKSELVSHCIDVLTKTGVTIVSLTFDGCPTNINMVKILGCGLYADNFNTSFKVDGVANTISIIPDPAHMVKLIRNAFGEKRQFIDMDGGVIDFEYINKLLILQEDEGCHLANKLKEQHVFYSRQKMKVKLATQLLSRSVSEALTFCRDKLELPAFKDSGPTIKFIKYFNDAFDILNSRSINQYGKSKAICKKNIIEIKEFYEEFSNYIKKLKLVENKNGQITHVLILKSARKNGFLGFLICFESLNSLYNNYLMPVLIDYICFYKLSQDHIELFFGTIRSHGGHNDNPTARQFRSAYHKLLINAKIKDGSLGNCIPLDEIYINWEIYLKALPDVSTIRKWYSKLDGLPGMTKESFQAISLKVKGMKVNGKQLYGCLVMDEMSIKQHVHWTGTRHQGYIDFGLGGKTEEMDNLPYAKDAFVIMVVGMNTSWKVPIAYYLINGISAEEKANIILNCLQELDTTGIIIKTLTFDGAANNLSMASELGANLQYSELKPYFLHPNTNDKIHIILDPCHMVKLLRNCLGDWKILYTTNGETIKWSYFKNLVNLQNESGLHSATKLRNRHIYYFREKMKVRLSVQTFSTIVANAILFCMNDLKLDNFQGADATIEFCLRINNIFDILNTRNFLSKGTYNKSINKRTKTEIFHYIEESIDYLAGGFNAMKNQQNVVSCQY
ncbi:hypothetical protein QTP88_011274 [Uroleucon formosanum]